MNIDSDLNPKCFQVDHNNNQIEVSYRDGKETSLFPVIIDEDIDQDGNLVTINSDNEDFDELTDQLNLNRYLKRNNATSTPAKESKTNDNDEDDEMFKSLRRVSTAYDALNNKNVRFSLLNNNRKMSTVPFQPYVTKQLTFIINEIYFTNGKTSLELVQRTNKLQTKFFVRKKLFNKSVRCVGTSLKNCVQSDIISIDIDEKSTLLPMMCKLMIIVEGAVIERGEPVLVRDFAIQVNFSSSGEEIHYDEKHQYMSSYTTEDNTDDEDDDRSSHEHPFIKEPKSQYSKLSRVTNNRNKIRKFKKQLSISGRRDSYYRRQSYFNINEYSSVPYYQYSLVKDATFSDAETMTDDYYLTANNNIMIINNSTSKRKDDYVNIPIQQCARQVEEDEEIEINIPINIESNNHRYLKVNQGIYRYKPICSRRRTSVYEETYNKFEADVKSYNAKYLKHYSRNSPVIYTFYHTGNETDAERSKKPFVEIENERSVTQVFLGHLVNGNLNNP